MTYATVIAERAKEGQVGIMALNRPKVNAWNRQLVEDMAACLNNFKNDPNVRVVIIKSNCNHFSAGMDFEEVLNQTGDLIKGVFRRNYGILTLLRSMPQITIAQVHGVAAALGTHLTFYCDLAVASEDASFGAPPINLGMG
jgi:2-(1,2-epoxy-1,2-dihydrophenyl)acetyl-CoA isomerase